MWSVFIREQSKFYSNLASTLTNCQFTNEPNREISRGVFQNHRVRGQAFPFLPSPFHFFFCSNFRAITRLETLATQAKFSLKWWQNHCYFLGSQCRHLQTTWQIRDISMLNLRS